ncbi:Forty-two-three domain-containing protein 1 [Podarcis lilfordi]|uniref:Forty-two-three domain-containing protein 1 n=1 Tax=Podarcis lilfordi TaxID=74358 RepID=A0AA35LC02_9SAUR|nr:Forty-two-three domain-containing protein 1 [Podarcis lilfordi]
MAAPGAGPMLEAAGAGAGSEPAVAAEEIDLSLDDIIKRNKKGQTNAKENRWKQPLKNWNPAYSNRRRRFWGWVPRNLQGPSRFRGEFQKQQNYRKPFWNGVTSPRRRAALGPKGMSPLNRPSLAQQVQQEDATLVGSRDGTTPGTQQRDPTRVNRFRRAGAAPPTAQSNQPFQLNRRPAFFQRQSRFNFNRRQTKSNVEGKPLKRRRWQPEPNPGGVLTVSVSNPQASQASMPGPKHPFPRGRRGPEKMSRSQPKGVPLRFNFRAMANQTSLTLNERFSGLRNTRHFTAKQNTGRMVTLPLHSVKSDWLCKGACP